MNLTRAGLLAERRPLKDDWLLEQDSRNLFIYLFAIASNVPYVTLEITEVQSDQVTSECLGKEVHESSETLE